MDALSRYIPDTNIEEEVEPVINVIQGKHEHNSAPTTCETQPLIPLSPTAPLAIKVL